jgi:hypothetical protein
MEEHPIIDDVVFEDDIDFLDWQTEYLVEER